MQPDSTATPGPAYRCPAPPTLLLSLLLLLAELERMDLAATHPLEHTEAHSAASAESLPTPPRSPTGQRPLDHAPADLEAATATTPSPMLGPGASLGYFPPLTPVASHDPLLLRSRLQTEDHISSLRKRKGDKSSDFYQRQNAHIHGLLKHLDDHVREAEEDEDTHRLPVRPSALQRTARAADARPSDPLTRLALAAEQIKIAVYGSLIANWCARVPSLLSNTCRVDAKLIVVDTASSPSSSSTPPSRPSRSPSLAPRSTRSLTRPPTASSTIVTARPATST